MPNNLERVLFYCWRNGLIIAKSNEYNEAVESKYGTYTVQLKRTLNFFYRDLNSIVFLVNS